MRPQPPGAPGKQAQVNRLTEAVRKSARAASASDSLSRKLTLSTLKRALGLLEGYWALGSVVMVLAILVSAGGLAAPWLGKQIIDDGFPREGLAGDMAAVNRGCMALLVIQVFIFVAGYVQALLFNRIGQNAMDALRRRVFAHMQYLSIGFYERREPGKVIARVTSDVDSVNELLRLVLQGLATDVLKAVGISIILFAMQWKLALIAHLVVPLASFTMWAFRMFGERIFRRIRETIAGISTYLHETMTGIRVGKAFAREDVSREVFSELTLESAEAGIAQGRLFGTLFPVIQFFTVGTMVALLSYGALLVMRLELTRGELFAFYAYAMMLGDPWRSLAELAMIAQRSAVALDRIFEVLDEQPTVVDAEGARERDALRGRPLRLRRRHGSAPRCELLGPGRPGYRDRRPDGSRQVHDHQAPRAPLRRYRGTYRFRRCGHPRRNDRVRPAPDRPGAAGSVPVRRHARGEHRVRPAGRDARRHRARGRPHAGDRARRAPAQRPRHAGPRARGEALRW